MVFSTFLHSFTRSQPGEGCRFEAEPRRDERVNIICRTSGAHASTTENPGLARATFCRRSAALSEEGCPRRLIRITYSQDINNILDLLKPPSADWHEIM